ncbi:MAG: hypothetical protein CVV50_04700 [Spirochaetae bacterium HGW-Spirochaetae-6]|jgi:pantoate kinase|nr:MAG: hypothetical protein CVV50_04700 [Spirochaetae bacterium HGW-Spirochaetae-6]
MKTVDRWLASPEFQKFLEIAQEVYRELTGSNSVEDLQKVQRTLVEMGSRYNHLIFQVSEDQINDLKAMASSAEEITRSVLAFIGELEKTALERYPEIMKIFFRYREKTKNHK